MLNRVWLGLMFQAQHRQNAIPDASANQAKKRFFLTKEWRRQNQGEERHCPFLLQPPSLKQFALYIKNELNLKKYNYKHYYYPTEVELILVKKLESEPKSTRLPSVFLYLLSSQGGFMNKKKCDNCGSENVAPGKNWCSTCLNLIPKRKEAKELAEKWQSLTLAFRQKN